MKLIPSQVISIKGLARTLLDRLTQHPGFYNIRHYTKSRARGRHRHHAW